MLAAKKHSKFIISKGRMMMMEMPGCAADILDSLADGAYVTDRDRKILFWNRAAEKILGWRREDILGLNCRDNLLVHVDKDGHALCGEEFCPLHRSIVTGQPSEAPLLVFAQDKEGRRVPVEVSVAPLYDAEGVEVGGVEIFRDMTGLMKDMEKARLIQEHALECALDDDPRVALSRLRVSHGIVGGDFYHARRISADEYAIMIADVMGHGIASALYCMQLRALWDELVECLPKPAVFLEEMNARLHRLAHDDYYFASAAAVVVNAATGALRYAVAGHPPLLVLGAGDECRELEGPGMALGMTESSQCEEQSDVLANGETLLLYTDGAFEVTDNTGALLGIDGLVTICRQEGLPLELEGLRRIEEKLLTYSDFLRFDDDLTMLAFSRLG
jgi:PAS domain S-box-containing protein